MPIWKASAKSVTVCARRNSNCIVTVHACVYSNTAYKNTALNVCWNIANKKHI